MLCAKAVIQRAFQLNSHAFNYLDMLQINNLQSLISRKAQLNENIQFVVFRLAGWEYRGRSKEKR